MPPNDNTPDTSREILGQPATGAPHRRMGTSGASPTPPNTVSRNPVDQYPRPPFRRQEQQWPGLASRMNPKPDHGETTYHGSGRMAGRRALITGGDSGIGR